MLLRDAELLERQREVHVHALGVADVEEAVGFRGEAGADDRAVDPGVLRLELGRILGPGQLAGVQGVGHRGGLGRGGVVGHGEVSYQSTAGVREDEAEVQATEQQQHVPMRFNRYRK